VAWLVSSRDREVGGFADDTAGPVVTQRERLELCANKTAAVVFRDVAGAHNACRGATPSFEEAGTPGYREFVALLRDGRAREVAPTMQAMERHEAARADAARHSIWVTGCRSWYLDDRGIPATWPWTFDRFRQVMAAPDLDSYELVGATTA